ncbi:hypothetical protein AB0442_39345 [Kitasatospora sp. NPDC085895]|uniref:hypothetical protein n=1 Tax=Kitasatospora sp. NPDC085895 TaxID=3155057 RepID=UPI00344F6E56
MKISLAPAGEALRPGTVRSGEAGRWLTRPPSPAPITAPGRVARLAAAGPSGLWIGRGGWVFAVTARPADTVRLVLFEARPAGLRFDQRVRSSELSASQVRAGIACLRDIIAEKHLPEQC